MADSDSPSNQPPPQNGSTKSSVARWVTKFRYAFRGLIWACRTQNSFWIHMPVAVAVLLVATILQIALWEWVTLIIVIGTVFSAELANSAIEQIVKVVHPELDERIGQALDAAAAAVLAVSISAAVVGVVVLGPKLLNLVI